MQGPAVTTKGNGPSPWLAYSLVYMCEPSLKIREWSINVKSHPKNTFHRANAITGLMYKARVGGNLTELPTRFPLLCRVQSFLT